MDKNINLSSEEELQNSADWAKVYKGANVMKQGIATYKDEKVYIANETLHKCMPTIKGRPVIPAHIRGITPENMQEHAVGYVTGATYDEYAGTFGCDFVVFNEKGKALIDRGYSLSTCYVPLAFAAGGTCINTPYDKEITDLTFTHLALVDAPRYEDAKIYENSKDADEEGKWITIKGTHVFVKKGQSADEAIAAKFGREKAERDGWEKSKQGYGIWKKEGGGQTAQIWAPSTSAGKFTVKLSKGSKVVESKTFKDKKSAQVWADEQLTSPEEAEGLQKEGPLTDKDLKAKIKEYKARIKGGDKSKFSKDILEGFEKQLDKHLGKGEKRFDWQNPQHDYKPKGGYERQSGNFDFSIPDEDISGNARLYSKKGGYYWVDEEHGIEGDVSFSSARTAKWKFEQKLEKQFGKVETKDTKHDGAIEAKKEGVDGVKAEKIKKVAATIKDKEVAQQVLDKLKNRGVDSALNHIYQYSGIDGAELDKIADDIEPIEKKGKKPSSSIDGDLIARHQKNIDALSQKLPEFLRSPGKDKAELKKEIQKLSKTQSYDEAKKMWSDVSDLGRAYWALTDEAIAEHGKAAKGSKESEEWEKSFDKLYAEREAIYEVRSMMESAYHRRGYTTPKGFFKEKSNSIDSTIKEKGEMKMGKIEVEENFLTKLMDAASEMFNKKEVDEDELEIEGEKFSKKELVNAFKKQKQNEAEALKKDEEEKQNEAEKLAAEELENSKEETNFFKEMQERMNSAEAGADDKIIVQTRQASFDKGKKIFG